MRVCVVIVNWNGWRDTLECLESLLRSDIDSLTVVVCDNASEDGSAERIRDWAEGRVAVCVAPHSPLRYLSHPPLLKPVTLAEYTREEAEAGGDLEQVEAAVILVHTGANLGFAGGSNVGLRYVLARGQHDFVWLLNNDTVVRPDALRHMLDEALRGPDVGIVGSTLRFYDRPHRVQVLGGASYNRWLALPRQIGMMQPADTPVQAEEVLRQMDYVAGASMLVPVRFLHEVGLLSEDYFLYFEEMDWAERARGRFRLAYAAEAVIFHREGGTIGSGGSDGTKSWTADYHFHRNRLRFTRKFAPARLPTVYFALLVSVLRRARHGQWDRVRMILKLMTTA